MILICMRRRMCKIRPVHVIITDSAYGADKYLNIKNREAYRGLK